MDKRKGWIAPIILGLALIVAIVWGYNEYATKNEMAIALENQYQRLFFDIQKHVENVQVNISKALLSESRDQNVLLLSQIMNEAYFAQDKLGQMPVTHADTAETEKFLNQAADYSFSLIETHLEGEDLTEEQRETLANLQNNSAKFNSELSKLQSELSEGGYLIGGMNRKQNMKIREGNEKILLTSIGDIEKDMAESPELIYDGPFSDQMLNKKPVGLRGGNVSQGQAEKRARAFFGKDRVEAIESFEQGKDLDKTRIPSYTFNLQAKNLSKELGVYMGVSQKGGKVLWMSNPRPVSKTTLSIEEAQEKALKYLKEKGFKNMEANYHLKYNGTVLFNFVNKEKGITIYPDLVKVKVALDNGETVGFDASAYYLNHHDRDIEEVVIDLEEAKSKIKTNFDIDSTRLALIPKGSVEKLCYEFKGQYNDSDYIVYINAIDGREEDILQIIKDENGTLTF